MPNKKWKTHPRTYGKDSRGCKLCASSAGLIRRYDMNLCRRCFRENAGIIGFIKVKIT